MKKITIGLCPSYGLGDALVFLVLAQNLANQGFSVTVYSDALSALATFFPDFSVENAPVDPSMLLHQDFVIAEKVSIVSNVPKAQTKFAFIGLSSLPAHLKPEHPAMLLSRVSPEKRESLQLFLPGAGVSLKQHYRGFSAVRALQRYCHDFLHMLDPVKAVHLSPPVGVREEKRICLHPTSSHADKNWPRHKYIRLAHRLEACGYQVACLLTPDVRETWLKRGVPARFLPTFLGLNDLADYLRQARLFIGNDSGLGHLASLLGVPTITLTYSRNAQYFWRPDWSPGHLLPAVWYFKWLGRPVWKPFLSVGRVYRAVLKVCCAGLT